MPRERDSGKTPASRDGKGTREAQGGKGPELVQLSDFLNKEEDERKEFLLQRIKELKKAIKEDRVTNFILEWEGVPEEPETEDALEGHMVFWNREESLDVAISKIARLQNRMILIAEGFIGPGDV